MKITSAKKLKATPLPTIAEVLNGIPFIYNGTTLVKVGVSGKFLNSTMVTEVLNRGSFFCLNLTTGMMTVLNGNLEVTLPKYQFTIIDEN